MCFEGGHTAEMLSIVNTLEKDRFVPRFYIAAGTDSMSLQKARFLEESLIQKEEVCHFQLPITLFQDLSKFCSLRTALYAQVWYKH